MGPSDMCVCIFSCLSAPLARESDLHYVFLKAPLTQIRNSRALD